MNHYTHLTLKERELLKHFIEAVIQKIMRRKEGQNHDHPLDGWS